MTKKSSPVAYVKECCGKCYHNDNCSKYRRLMEKDPVMYQTGYIAAMGNCGRWKMNETLTYNGLVDIWLDDSFAGDHRKKVDNYIYDYRNSKGEEYRVRVSTKGFEPQMPKTISLRAKANVGESIFYVQQTLIDILDNYK